MRSLLFVVVLCVVFVSCVLIAKHPCCVAADVDAGEDVVVEVPAVAVAARKAIVALFWCNAMFLLSV